MMANTTLAEWRERALAAEAEVERLRSVVEGRSAPTPKGGAMDQHEFVREHQAEAVGIARRTWAIEKPFVVHYLGCRAQPARAKSESARFATWEEAEEFARRIVSEWGTAAASIWEEVPRGIALGEASRTVMSPLVGREN